MIKIRFILLGLFKIARKKMLSNKPIMCLLLLLLFYLTQFYRLRFKRNKNILRSNRHRLLWQKYHEFNIESRMEIERGTGCEMPKTDPFAKEIMDFISPTPKITCALRDWVTCNGSECYVVKEIVDIMPTVECHYSDIIYVNDDEYFMETPVIKRGTERYILTRSDHVKVYCAVDNRFPLSIWSPKWYGIKAGFRKIEVNVPPDRKGSPNVIVVAFDSVSHNQFLRRLPLAYNFLTQKLNGIVFNSYNVVGDGTNAALFPILTGKTELELPEARKGNINNTKLNPWDFLFFQLREDGYHTAYFEDLPEIGTFQQKYNGFKYQPADHYLRAFFMEANKMTPDCLYCVGGIARYNLMLNLTHQFASTEGKRFGFTLISHITHDGDYLKTADTELVQFLLSFEADGLLQNTLLIIMADHGTRFDRLRMTYQCKIEERLPFMAIVLPEKLKKARPRAEESLRANADILTTPFDIHSTILDVVGLHHLRNNYKVHSSELPRSMSLLEPIPSSRSCAEADVLTHWCACLNWENVSPNDPVYKRAADAVVLFINRLISGNTQCARRSLTSIEWVVHQNLSRLTLDYRKNGVKQTPTIEYYQVMIVMSPGYALFEATIAYLRRFESFVMSEGDISRVNAYGVEPNCIVNTLPHLVKFCYCTYF